MTDTVNVDTLVERLRTHITTDGLVVPSDEALATLDDLAARARDADELMKRLTEGRESEARLWDEYRELNGRRKAAEADRDRLQAEVRTQDTLIQRWMTTAEDEKARADRLARRVAELEAALLKIRTDHPTIAACPYCGPVIDSALAGDGGGACDGSSDCEATVHLHGCYSDDGTNCDHPSEHTAGDGGDDAAIVKTIRERDAADTGERITLGDLVADIEAAREEADGDGGGAAADTTEDTDASH